MSFDRLFNVNDAGAAFLISITLLIVFFLAVVLGFLFVLPLAIVAIITYGVYRYATKPEVVPTSQLVATAERRIETAGFPSPAAYDDAFVDRLYDAVVERQTEPPAYPIFHTARQIALALYREEQFDNPLPPVPPANTIAEGRYRDMLIAFQNKTADAPRTLGQFNDTVAQALISFIQALPPAAFVPQQVFHQLGEDSSAFGIGLLDAVKNPAPLVWGLMSPFFSENVTEKGLFAKLRSTLTANASEISSREFVAPENFKGTPRELVHAYLKDTPFEALFDQRLPFTIRDEDYGEHCLICAGAGWGKTQLLQTMIATFLERDDPPSLIVMDSTGAIINAVQRLAVFDGRLKDRILIIDPEQSPSLNMFDLSTPRFQHYSVEEKEQLQNEVVDLFNYIFASEEYDLTSQMGLAFSYAVRLMLSRPESTIIDLRKLLEEPALKKGQSGYSHSAFSDDIDRLDEDTREFFTHHFFDQGLEGTRASIARRIHKLMGVSAFKRMFAASSNTLDLFAEMQRGVICLVNTNQQVLKDSHVLFGRYVIARALAAALERAVIKDPQNRKQAFLLIDEASAYTDENIETLLTKVRQFKLGVTLVYQHLDHKELDDTIRSALYSSTAVKFVGGANSRDRGRLSKEMETSGDFLAAQRRDSSRPPQWSQWAVYVRNYTDSAVSIFLPFYKLEKMPKMSDGAHVELLERNRAKVSSISAPEPDTPPPREEVNKEAQPAPKGRPQSDHGEAGVY